MNYTYKISTGTLTCYPTYVIFDFKAKVYSVKEGKELVKVINRHYKNRKCVIITNREMQKNIDPRSYLEVKSKCILGVAIVSKNNYVKEEVIKEQELYAGVFTYFNTIEDAISWSTTLLK